MALLGTPGRPSGLLGQLFSIRPTGPAAAAGLVPAADGTVPAAAPTYSAADQSAAQAGLLSAGLSLLANANATDAYGRRAGFFQNLAGAVQAGQQAAVGRQAYDFEWQNAQIKQRAAERQLAKQDAMSNLFQGMLRQRLEGGGRLVQAGYAPGAMPSAPPSAGDPAATPATAFAPDVPDGGTGNVPSYAATVFGTESNNRLNAKNPLSSATGPAQFLRGIWLDFIRDRHPEWADRPEADLLALRSDPNQGYALNVEATEWLAGTNKRSLETMEVEATPAALGMAHYLGPQVTSAVYNSNADTPMRDLIPAIVGEEAAASWLKANPPLQRQTAGDLRTQYDRRFAGVAMPGQAAPAPVAAGSADASLDGAGRSRRRARRIAGGVQPATCCRAALRVHVATRPDGSLHARHAAAGRCDAGVLEPDEGHAQGGRPGLSHAHAGRGAAIRVDRGADLSDRCARRPSRSHRVGGHAPMPAAAPNPLTARSRRRRYSKTTCRPTALGKSPSAGRKPGASSPPAATGRRPMSRSISARASRKWTSVGSPNLRKQVDADAQILPTFEAIQTLLLSGANTGALQPYQTAIGGFLADIGALSRDQAAALNQEQLLQSLVSNVVPRMRPIGSGASSDTDVRLYKQAVPSLGNTPESNLLIIGGYTQVRQKQVLELDAMDDYLRTNGSLAGYNKWAKENLPPVFPRVKTMEDVQQYSPGTVIIYDGEATQEADGGPAVVPGTFFVIDRNGMPTR